METEFSSDDRTANQLYELCKLCLFLICFHEISFIHVIGWKKVPNNNNDSNSKQRHILWFFDCLIIEFNSNKIILEAIQKYIVCALLHDKTLYFLS